MKCRGPWSENYHLLVICIFLLMFSLALGSDNMKSTAETWTQQFDLIFIILFLFKAVVLKEGWLCHPEDILVVTAVGWGSGLGGREGNARPTAGI